VVGRRLAAAVDVAAEVDRAGIRRERLAGFDFVRRREGEVAVYYLRREAGAAFEGWLPLGAAGGTARALDPVTGVVEAVPARVDGHGTSVRLSVEPGGTRIVEVGPGFGPVADAGAIGLGRRSARRAGAAADGAPAARTVAVPGPWKLSWTDGAGVAHRVEAGRLAPWPDLPGIGLAPAAVEYTAEVDLGGDPGDGSWVFDLGDLRGSASVAINGIPIGTAWTAPYRLAVPRGVLGRRATLRLRVLAVEANRVIDLDRRGVPWRKFFFVNRDYEPFDASGWTPLPVGLLGPVSLASG
jgi:hypothetical protein